MSEKNSHICFANKYNRFNLFYCSTAQSVAVVVYKSKSTPVPKKTTDSVLSILLDRPIHDAINHHFGSAMPQIAIYHAKVEELEQVENQLCCRLKISVPTFYGTHNNHGIAHMTFLISILDIKLIEYDYTTI